MKVLAVVPIWNRTEFVQEALDSLDAQTVQPARVVVTGNVRLPHREGVESVYCTASLDQRVNDIVSITNCDAFVLLCDDDKLDPRYLERCIEAMETSKVDVVFTDVQHFGTPAPGWVHGAFWDPVRKVWPTGPFDETLDYVNTVPPTALCKKSAWKAAGGYQSVGFFDWDFWWRCYWTGSNGFRISDPLFLYRWHATQDTNLLDMQVLNQKMIDYHAALKARRRWSGDVSLYDGVAFDDMERKHEQSDGDPM